MKKRYFWAIAALVLALSACKDGNRVKEEQFAFLDKMGITVTDKLLLGDSLTLPDIYCGDPNQKVDDLKGVKLDREQFETLVVPAGHDFVDEMGNWLLLGVRDMGSGITLAAIYSASGAGYSVDLMTYDRQGRMLDAINGREQHVLWRIDFSNIKNDTVFTLDGRFTFDGNRVTLYRLM